MAKSQESRSSQAISSGTPRGNTEATPSLVQDTFPLTAEDTRWSSGMEPLCWERVGETTRHYNVRTSSSHKTLGIPGMIPGRGENSIVSFDVGRERGAMEVLTHLFQSYFLPDGFPDSVGPSYTPYMRWRAVQYFFGGAMSVFTTRSLLHSLGIAKGAKAASGALAVNWVIKDGAGRLGKFLFARQGKKFDADLKQMRLASSMLMGVGAGLELSTVAVPGFFLPLACAANVLKNIGAVTNTSTRAPIYKAFARKENMGDITAKGECISNLADLCGTGFGIILARHNPSLQRAFLSLSLGYIIASYNETRAVHLPTLNRSRFSVAVNKFLETGNVPGIPEVSKEEHIFEPPWAVQRPVEIGARVADAFENAEDFRMARQQCKGEKFLVNFRPSQRRAYVVLQEGAGSKDVIKGTFCAHLLLHQLSQRDWAYRRQQLAAEDKEGCIPADTKAGAPRPCDLILQPQSQWASASASASASAPAAGSGLDQWSEGEVDEWYTAAAAAPLATLRQRWQGGWLRRNARERSRQHALTVSDVRCALASSRDESKRLFEEFISKASTKGWVIAESLLNPGEARLLVKQPAK